MYIIIYILSLFSYLWGSNIYLRSLKKDFAIGLVRKTANFQRAEMIVKSPFYIPKYRVGPYQLIGSRLFAVPPNDKTGPALYVLWRSPVYRITL
jgi:hypothetical protein